MADELVPNREIIKNAVLRSESFTTSGFVQSKMFRSCRFVETDFFSIRFEHCDFFDCVFENVDMSGSVFRRCSFAECSLLRSNFNHSRFESCHFGNADGEGTKISSSNFTQAEFTGDPVHNRMDRVLFEHCSLDFARFVAFSPFGVEFVDCNLQEALIERCRSERIDVRTCSCRGLQLRDNELGAFVSYKEKFIRTIGVAALIGACDLDIDGSALRLGKQTERDDLAAVAEAVQRLRDEAADAGRLFEQINSEIILRTIQDRYSISKRERGSITSNVVTTQLEKRVVGMPIQISDVTLAILALEAASALTASDINVLAQLGIAILSQHQPSDIELGKHILTLNRVASNHKIDQYEIALILGQSSDFSVLIGLSNALSSTVPEGDIVLQELARGSIKSVLSANSKGFLIVVLILLKLGISVKYTGDGNFHFHLSFDGNLMVTDGKAKLQYEQHRGEISAEELERRVKKLRSSGLLPNDLRELEAQAGELSAARLPAVRSFVRQAMPHRDFSKVPPQVASASSELSELPRPSL